MTIQLVILFLLFLGGQAVHLLFYDFPKKKKTAKLANVTFNPADMFKEEWYLWIGNVLVGVLCLALFALTPRFQTRLGEFSYVAAVLLGGFGSSYIQSRFSTIQHKINKAIDEKTNIADGVQPAPPHPQPPLVNDPNA